MTKIIDEIRKLRRLGIEDLRARYRKVFAKDPPPTRGQRWLWREISWRLQADAAESSPERGHLQVKLKTTAPARLARRKPDLPAPGTVITRRWRGRDLELRVLDDGFEVDGVVHRTLSAAAKAVTGAHWSGHLFWNLKPRKRGKK